MDDHKFTSMKGGTLLRSVRTSRNSGNFNAYLAEKEADLDEQEASNDGNTRYHEIMAK